MLLHHQIDCLNKCFLAMTIFERLIVVLVNAILTMLKGVKHFLTFNFDYFNFDNSGLL